MVKRTFDFIISLIGLIFLVPIFLIIGLLIKIFMPGDIFFRQERIGKDGKLFTLIKFRTMKVNESKNHITTKGDSRITTFGLTLRKYKLDELPELLNVLKGDMSLVGPRPDVPGYADKLEDPFREILKLRPGITGPATLKYSNEEDILALVEDPVKYNNEIIFPDKALINLNYLKTQSLTGDIKIIFKTIFRKY